MSSDQFLKYMTEVAKDKRLSVWHLVFIFALLQLAHQQKKTHSVLISRRKVMELSHINTIPTYHKYLRDLQSLGYIHYTPSYHPKIRSKISLLNL